MDDDNQLDGDSPKPPKVIAACDICAEEAEVPPDDWYTRCKNKNCPGDSIIILRPLNDNERYVRLICEDDNRYAKVGVTTSAIKCSHGHEYTITDNVIEIRNNHLIYVAKRKTTDPERQTTIDEDRLKSFERLVKRLQLRMTLYFLISLVVIFVVLLVAVDKK